MAILISQISYKTNLGESPEIFITISGGTSWWGKPTPCGTENCNVGITMINYPPFITIFMGGINHQKWMVYHCYTNISCVAGMESLVRCDEQKDSTRN